MRHEIISGKGRIVKAEAVSKPQNPIVAKVKVLYDDDSEAVKFIDKICEEKPRYIIQQCRLLKKIHKQYGLKEALSAIDECAAKGVFDVTEVLTVLVQRHGIDVAEEILSVRTKFHYKQKAKGLNKYDERPRTHLRIRISSISKKTSFTSSTTGRQSLTESPQATKNPCS